MDGKKKKERRLKVACEFSADRIFAARATDSGDSLDTCTIRTLSSGTITPGLTNVNVVNRDVLVTTVSEALTVVGGHSRDIIAVIPDAACRIALLDFDTLPEKPQDAENIVRFRLKKSMPFDVDRARLSYDSHQSDGVVRVVAAVALPTVVEEYESVLRDAGFNPGFVIPSTLAALGFVDSQRPTLLVKGTSDAITLAIVYNNDLLLFRRLELTPGALVNPEQLADDIYPSLVFFQDTYGLPVEQIYSAGLPADVVPAIESSAGNRVNELVDSGVTTPGVSGPQRSLLSALVGALIS